VKSIRYLKKSINFETSTGCFCSIHLLQSGLKIWLPLKYNQLENAPAIARDVSSIGHWGTGDLELHVSNLSDLDIAMDLIHMAYEKVR